ncbi:MAG: HK97 family phage prohead protease [Clostridia bacterium]|nr:HK97 family phage prohead protease [Clostridia bacterium]
MEKAIKEVRLAEVRALEENESNEMIVEGYAVVFNQVTDLGWCKEIIDRNAFNGADMKDCVLKYNHNDSFLILARTRNKSLELSIDDHGLKIRAKLIDTTNNKDVYKMIKEGLLDKMSFAFTVAERSWDYETDTRTVLRIAKLYDVSVVDIPAYDNTEIYARSKEEYENEKREYEELKLEKQKMKLLLSL